jgi:hypothetical protein
MALLWLAPTAGWLGLSAWLARKQERLAASRIQAASVHPPADTLPNSRRADDIRPA